jgi:hypothetical protein
MEYGTVIQQEIISLVVDQSRHQFCSDRKVFTNGIYIVIEYESIHSLSFLEMLFRSVVIFLPHYAHTHYFLCQKTGSSPNLKL